MKKENAHHTSLKPLARIDENQKLPKPLIEKKRRARINRSLSDLRVLISDLLKKELMRTRSRRKSGKVEKADVLELAVQYIKEMKQEKSVQKELAFEQGYQMCQVNVDNYFRKINELHSKPTADGKPPTCDDQWTHKPWLIQKDLLKTLDTQWTEHVQATSYSRKMEQQRLSQCGSNAERAAEMNADQLKNQLAVDQAYIEKSAASNKLNQQTSDAPFSSSGSSINEKIDHLQLQNLSKNHCFNSPVTTKKLYPTMWKDKTLSKVDELISIKMYNQIVMQNLNRNKSLCSSASSTSSCSSGSSYAKTINSLTNSYLSSNQPANPTNPASTVSNPVMPTDLESANVYPSSSGSSCCSVNSAASSSTQSSSTPRTASKEQEKSSITLPKYSHYSNSPLKKRKKFISQYAFDSSPGLTDKMDDSLWRPW